MEKLLMLRPRPQPVWVRYAVATVIIVIFFLVEAAVSAYSGFTAMFILLPAVFLVGILFDRGTGVYAAFLATALLAWFFLPDILSPDPRTVPLVLFFLTGLATALVSESLRKFLERLVAAERGKDLLLREMAHRTKNNLATVCSLLRIQARAAANEPVRESLTRAATRVEVMADVHEFLRESAHGRDVDMRAYLQELCQKLAGALRGVRPVTIAVDVPYVQLPAETAVPIGMVVNELVTNSFKYAFPDERSGTIAVSLKQDGDALEVVVEDDGVGCADDAIEGLGSRLMRLMTQQLRGTLQREQTPSGCRVKLSVKP
ncbi:MAG TPA: histidine kinase dimerization/phosphoacceptor domain -containing protein [Xanthobacteraceae bacterium]|nr:histidine kinase dimerization/phosphoacceptor domain -containing protein [Xanthobacteraceae bacterium]